MEELATMARARETWPHHWVRGLVLVENNTDLAHTQDFELAHPNSYLIYDLLEHVKKLVLWNHSHRNSMTTGNSRRYQRNLSGGPILDPEARGLEPDQQPIAMNI